jgi:hypothetical protein
LRFIRSDSFRTAHRPGHGSRGPFRGRARTAELRVVEPFPLERYAERGVVGLAVVQEPAELRELAPGEATVYLGASEQDLERGDRPMRYAPFGGWATW